MNERQNKRKKQNREEPEWVVFVFVVVAVAVGILLMSMHQRKTVEFETDTLSFEYPASWIKEVTFSGNAEGSSRTVHNLQTIFKAQAMQSESGFAPKLEVKKLTISRLDSMNPASGLTEAVTYLTMRYSQRLSNFEVFEIGTREIAGIEGVLVEYSSVHEAVESSVRKSFPIPVYGIDFLLEMENGAEDDSKQTVYLFTFRTAADKVDGAVSELEKIIKTLSIENQT